MSEDSQEAETEAQSPELLSESDLGYVISGSLDTDDIDKIVAFVTEHYKDHDELQFNLEHIETVGTAAVQAFISINRYAKSNNKELQWQGSTPVFIDAFNTLGLYSEIMKMEIK